MSTNKSASQEQSLIFQLPAELRIAIYEMVLVLPSGYWRRRPGYDRHSMPCVPDQDRKVTIVDPTYSTQAWPKITRCSVLAILQTCRRTRDEAQTIFYKLNHLRVLLIDERSRCDRNYMTKVLSVHLPEAPTRPPAEGGLTFLAVLNATRKNAIRDLTIVVRDATPTSIALLAETVRTTPELTTLCIEVGGGSHDCFPPKEHRFPELCREVARSRSLRSVSFVIVFPKWMIGYGGHAWGKWQQRVGFMQTRTKALVAGSERRPGKSRTVSFHLDHAWASEGEVVKGNGPL
ncbi:hypothetical protein LTR17_020669 [Elasticomyces elasticus]|nr:hypothetical protein LTR17_020669 [Elasticomyces elasticus]